MVSDWEIAVLCILGVSLALVARTRVNQFAEKRVIQFRDPLVPKDFWKVSRQRDATSPPLLVWLSRGITPDFNPYMYMMDVLQYFQTQGWATCICTPTFLQDAPSSVPIFQYYQKTFVELAVQRADWLIAEHGTMETAITTAERARKRLLLIVHEEESGSELALVKTYPNVHVQILYTTKALQERFKEYPGFVMTPPFILANFKTHTSKLFTTLSPDASEEDRDVFLEMCAADGEGKFLCMERPDLPPIRAPPRNLTIWKRTDRRSLWTETGILVVPSDREEWGRTALEAAAAGIPTIAHPTESMKETMGDAALYVERSNVRGYVKQIQELRTNVPLYETRSRLARAAANGRSPYYDWERLKLMFETSSA